MAWKYRKRIKIAPGVNVNISRSGVSTTIGPKGASVNIGKNGTYLNTGIPGTGIYDRQKIGGGSGSHVTNSPSSTNTGSTGYDNSGCYWFVLCCVIACIIVYLVRKEFDALTYLYSLVSGLVIWVVGLCIVSASKTTQKPEAPKQEPEDSHVEEEADEVDHTSPDSLLDSNINADNTGMGYLDWEREDFELMHDAVNELYDFYKSASRSIKVRKELDQLIEIVDGSDEPWPMKKKLSLSICIDVYRCYSGLGYGLGKGEGEELALLLFGSKICVEGFQLDYFQIPNYRTEVAPPIRELFEFAIHVSESLPLPYGQFIFQRVFEKIDHTRLTQYMTLLYRYASTVAKADGTIDAREIEWLANLMKAKDCASDGTPLEKKTPRKRVTKVSEEAIVPEATEENEIDISPLDQLRDLVGLDSVKEEVEKLSNFIKITKIRQERGLPTSPISYHCVFTGNPGTGKTTVARIIAGIYKELGVLKKGHLVETDRSGLIAEYIGQTAVKTNNIIDSALDGVLFIDEAYSLVQGSKNDYGNEAISTLLKRMEDEREKLVVILAGYGDEMQCFIDSNPGLQSRFNRYINFPDYDAENLFEIFKKNLSSHQYVLSDKAEQLAKNILQEAVLHKDKNFGNARYVRNLFEKTLENQATRLASDTHLTTEKLTTIAEEDIPK